MLAVVVFVFLFVFLIATITVVVVVIVGSVFCEQEYSDLLEDHQRFLDLPATTTSKPQKQKQRRYRGVITGGGS